MNRKLPPLKAIRAFECAARYLSFTVAAGELFVTQAAVSQQVKSLEDYLGVALFKRMNRSLALTAEGQTLLPHVRKAFDHLYRGAEAVEAGKNTGRITVSVLSSLAARWLVPKLGRFNRIQPNIDVLVSPSSQLTDFVRQDVDIAIRYGAGDYPGLRVDRLMGEYLFPVCSPRLTEGDDAVRCAADLGRVPLIHDDDYSHWRTWLTAAGLSNVNAERGTIFTDASMLLEAAIAGQGVALAREVLARRELEAGRLVRPFEMSLPTRFAYYVVSPEETAERPKVRLFRDWLLAEGAVEEELLK